MNLDVFKADAFSFHSLTKGINEVPFQPTRLGTLGVFQQEPISTLSVDIESDSETLVLVPSKPRGAPGLPTVPDRRKLRTFKAVHLPANAEIFADEVQGLRAFGSDSEVTTAQAWLNRKMAIARRRIDLTLEYQRVGAMKGQILDADGTTVLTNLFTEFGITQSTLSFALNVDTTKVNLKVIALKRMVEDALGGLAYTGIRVECSNEFFDAFTGHPAVVDAFADYTSRAFQRTDQRQGFDFCGVVFEEYRGAVGGTRFIGANKAYVIVEGVSDLYVQHYSPAPYTDTVNTMGMPVYARLFEKDKNMGFDCDMQSNPITLCTRPKVQVELSVS
jgi:hypothetical protein